jgi:hypothetical protein
MFAIFPALDLIFAGVAYCACLTLNDLELREVAKTPSDQAYGAAGEVQEKFRTSGIGNFAGLINYPNIEISYSTGAPTVRGSDKYVTVKTFVICKPLLAIPFFGKIPGLGAEVNYCVQGRRLLESPNYAPLDATEQ